MRRALITTGIAAALLALGLAPIAGADPAPLTITGAATPTNAVAPETVHYTYTLTVGAPATDVAITVAQDALIPADTGSIRFDGATVPADTVTAAAPGFTLRAGHGADADNGGSLTGTHTLTFSGAVSSTAPADTTSTATVTTGAGSVTSAPVEVTLNEPDLALMLPPDSGEDQSAPLGTGQTIYFDAVLRNLGAPSAGTLTLTLPTGLRVGSDGVMLYANESDYEDGIGDPLSCSGGPSTVTCALDTVATTGALGKAPIIEVALTATTAGTPGTSGSFAVSVAPTSGTDADPSNNAVGATIDFLGKADLTVAMTPDKPKVTVGDSATLTLRVTNHGPQAAPTTIALALLDGTKRFKVTGFDGPSLPTSPAVRTATKTALRNLAAAAPKNDSVRRFARAASSGLATSRAVSGLGALWFIGTLPAGGTATAHLTVKAKAKGTAHLMLVAISAANLGCLEDDHCRPTVATLTAVAAASTHSNDDNPVANTGAPVGELSVLGAGLLLAGAGLTTVGRRRRPRAQ